MEYLSQYEYMITYIKGVDNTVAGALSRVPEESIDDTPVAAIFSIENGPKLFTDIQKGYEYDLWCAGIMEDLEWNIINSKLNNGLLFVGSHLMVPKYKNLHEQLFQLAHDNLRHFGGEKVLCVSTT